MKVFCCQLDQHQPGSSSIKLVHTPLIENVSVTNSLAFAPDGKTMYFAGSPTTQSVA